MTAGKYEHLIVRRPVPVSSLPHHENMPSVQYPVLMSKSLVPEADVWATMLFASSIPDILAENIQSFGRAAPHKHTAPEIYILVGDDDAIAAEITLGGEKYEVSSPCCVYIPAGLPHSIRPIRARAGKAAGFIPVVLSGEYVTEDA
ncbi:MAG: hypothetical protein AB1742_08005 [bacterium]